MENGYTVPTLETLEKFARALEIPLYQLFYDGEEPTKLPNSLKGRLSDDTRWGSSGKETSYLHKLRKCLAKTEEPDRKVILLLAKKMVASKHAKLLGPRYCRGISGFSGIAQCEQAGTFVCQVTRKV